MALAWNWPDFILHFTLSLWTPIYRALRLVEHFFISAAASFDQSLQRRDRSSKSPRPSAFATRALAFATRGSYSCRSWGRPETSIRPAAPVTRSGNSQKAREPAKSGLGPCRALNTPPRKGARDVRTLPIAKSPLALQLDALGKTVFYHSLALLNENKRIFSRLAYSHFKWISSTSIGTFLSLLLYP